MNEDKIFTLKDIKGAVVEKKRCDGCGGEMSKTEILNGGYISCCPDSRYGEREYNKAIEAQSSVKLRFNREKVAKAISSQKGHTGI